MSEIVVKEVSSKKELKKFIRFNYELYKNCPYAVPDFLEDTLDTFDPEKNAAFDFCDAKLFLAYKNGKIVGRVAGIINNKANKTWDTHNVRFGWIDFIDDKEVSSALLKAVEDWGRQQGANKIVGPLGFTDLDPEGMLIDGFDQLSTMSTIYNYPYYPKHLEQLGFEKEVDWVERQIIVPDKQYERTAKYFRVAEMSAKRYNLHIRKFKNMREIREGNYGKKIFDVVNKAYAPLYGFSELSEKQIDQYVNSYLPLLDMRFLTVVEDEQDNIVAMGVGMPSLSTALQKAKGKLFPFGWFYLAKALFVKHSNIIDLLLIGVLPEYQNKGVNAMLFADLIPVAQKMGLKFAETHPQLETNEKSQVQWDYLDAHIHKKRRCYQKNLK
ncbi:MAG: GNAT family N-acetyltransferase [Paraprevotella sp.]|nr:GNAT family N-acetyltransferase [Paraprevotella sp.]